MGPHRLPAASAVMLNEGFDETLTVRDLHCPNLQKSLSIDAWLRIKNLCFVMD
jgi:hypothetical protein